MSSGVKPLKVHELESLFLLREVFNHVCKKVGERDSDTKYNQFLLSAKHYYHYSKSKVILERAKKRFEFHSVRLFNQLRHIPDLNTLEQSFVNPLKHENWSIYPQVIFQEERQRIENALQSESATEDFLKLLPGKEIIQKAADTLSIHKDRYVQIVLVILDDPQQGLRQYLKQFIIKFNMNCKNAC